jgi:hypothetical protein
MQAGAKSVKVGKIMMFINLMPQRLSVSGSVQGDIYEHFSFELSTDGLTNKFRISNVASLTSLSGKWSIDEDGNLIAESIKTKKLEVGTQELPSGITIYDTITKQPYCMYMANGVMSSAAGKCGEAAAPASGGSSPAPEPEAEPEPEPEPVAESAPEPASAPGPEPDSTSSPQAEPESTVEISSTEATEPEPTPEPAPEPAPAGESSSGGE